VWDVVQSSHGLTLDTRLSRAEDVRAVSVESVLYLLSVNQNRFYALEGTAREIWEMLDGLRTLRDIAAHLREAYGLPAGKAEADVVSFAGSLLDAGLVVKDKCSDEQEAETPA